MSAQNSLDQGQGLLPTLCKDLVRAELEEKHFFFDPGILVVLKAENCSTASLTIPLYRQTPPVHACKIPRGSFGAFTMA